VTAARMQEMGIETCADLRSFSEELLLEHFGSFGRRLHCLCRGIDERPVIIDQQRKSLSVENTYTVDLPDLDACMEQLPRLHGQLEERLQRVRQKYRVSKKFVKIRFMDFVSTTAEQLADNSDLAGYAELLQEAWQRGARPVRL